VTRTLQLAYASFRPRPAVPGQTVLSPSVTSMRVHLGDIDLYRHVNNGVYLQYMDIGRANYIADLAGYTLLNQRGWYPVVAASTVKYRRSLTLGQRFTQTTRVLGWDERVVYMEQVFERGGDHIARGIVAGRFLARDGRRIPAPDVVRLLTGDAVESPDLPSDVATWASAVDVAHRSA